MGTITVEGSQEINNVTYVCRHCLDLVTLLGYTKRVFIVSKPIFKKEVTCDICKSEPASFVLIPLGRGIYICEHCLTSLSAASKHRWNVWPKKPVKGGYCDLCGRPAAYHILPPKVLQRKKG